MKMKLEEKPIKYFQKTNDGKQILRDMMSSTFLLKSEAKKQGFSSPDASWFKGESIDFVAHSLLEDHARIYEVLDPAAVMPLIEAASERRSKPATTNLVIT